MKTLDIICKSISKDINKDYDTIKKIAMYQFQIVKDTMKDTKCTKDILLNNLMRFKLKTRYKNNKTLQYTTK